MNTHKELPLYFPDCPPSSDSFTLLHNSRDTTWEILDGHLGGEGVVLVGPFGDQGPQRGIGGKDAVVAMAVDAGRREELGQAVDELEGREAHGGAAGGIRVGQDVEDLVGVSSDEVEAGTNASRRCPRRGAGHNSE